MKKAHEEALTLTLGGLLANTVRFSEPVTPDLVVPVPMHWTRRITRGTNPADVLAEKVALKMRIPVASDLLLCRRKTSKQGMLLPDQRRRNVRDAYSVSAGYDIRDACVLLIDDVMTTGATGNEVSRVLRRAGARQVSVAVVARGTG
jgi:ComF family protein